MKLKENRHCQQLGVGRDQALIQTFLKISQGLEAYLPFFLQNCILELLQLKVLRIKVDLEEQLELNYDQLLRYFSSK